jgi:hypothetical protein
MSEAATETFHLECGGHDGSYGRLAFYHKPIFEPSHQQQKAYFFRSPAEYDTLLLFSSPQLQHHQRAEAGAVDALGLRHVDDQAAARGGAFQATEGSECLVAEDGPGLGAQVHGCDYMRFVHALR